MVIVWLKCSLTINKPTDLAGLLTIAENMRIGVANMDQLRFWMCTFPRLFGYHAELIGGCS